MAGAVGARGRYRSGDQAKYLEDTDWAVYYLRGREPYVTGLKEYRKRGLSISVISLAELYEGVFRAAKPQEREKTQCSL